VRLGGFSGFLVIWLGQFVSIFGSALTRFALTVWIYQETGSAVALSTAGFFALAPALVFLPLGGVLADRCDRRKLMIGSDTLGGLSTALLLVFLGARQLEVWHLYLANALLATAEAFQYPAFMAATATIVPQEHFGRANGLRDLAGNASRVFAPVAAAALLVVVDVGGILIIDLATFGLAILTLAMVTIPRPGGPGRPIRPRAGLVQDVVYGFQFIWRRPGLLGLQSIFLALNLIYTATGVLVPAMILSRTDQDQFVLGSLQSVMSVGALAGGVIISSWGGTKRKMPCILGCQILTAVLGRLWFGLGRGLVSWIPGAFFLYFFIPISNGSTGAIWMSKTPPEVQGRVLATRRFAAQISDPLGALVGGPLAERVFEPAMMPGGALAPLFGGLAGTGVGAGISLMMILGGVIGLLASLLVYLIPVVWRLEDLLPDTIQGPRATDGAEPVSVADGDGTAKGQAGVATT
jgi:DHA3 family macrolide efflux protein-like MFS transporter